MRFTQEIRQLRAGSFDPGSVKHLGISGDCQIVGLVFCFLLFFFLDFCLLLFLIVPQSKYDDHDGHFGSGFCGPTNQINLICLLGTARRLVMES